MREWESRSTVMTYQKAVAVRKMLKFLMKVGVIEMHSSHISRKSDSIMNYQIQIVLDVNRGR